MHKYDVIWILETKQIQSISVPGFIVFYKAYKGATHRGGVLLLIKNNLQKLLKNVNLTLESQIWFELSCYPNTRFGGIYIPPTDSLYYDQNIIANMCAQINDIEKVVILGDFNARVGKPDMLNTQGEKLEYADICDMTQNAPGKSLINLCKEYSLVVANHVCYGNKNLGGNLSYRKGNNWISELDLCLVHERCLPLVKELITRQEIRGSDHAPLCVTMDIKESDLIAPFILNRAKYLGQSYVTPQPNHKRLQRTESSRNIELNHFKSYMEEHQPPALSEDDLDYP